MINDFFVGLLLLLAILNGSEASYWACHGDRDKVMFRLLLTIVFITALVYIGL